MPDFPKPGIVFKDITPLLGDAKAFSKLIEAMGAQFDRNSFDTIAAIESRGFIFGAALAQNLGKHLVLIRKPGKLPHKVISLSYALEYGEDRLEVHSDSFVDPAKGRTLIVDDVLATGGTANAAVNLVAKAGGTPIGFSFAIELAFLSGSVKLPLPSKSVLVYD